MQKRVLTVIILIVGISLGVTFLPTAWTAIGNADNMWLNNSLTNGLIGAIIFYIISLAIVEPITIGVKRIEKQLNELSLTYILFGVIGAILGLTLGLIGTTPLYQIPIPFINSALPILIMLLLGYLGFRMGTTRIDELKKFFSGRNKKAETNEGEVLERKADDHFHKYKILDTSVIIDGRIYDIAKTGFLEGVLMIPNFVLYELQYIADSGESIKRVRGRRGLDILNKLRKEKIVPIEMYDGDFEDIPEVDSKLIALAKKVDGVIVTNDYNLNKVIQFQNVQVLNINNLAKSLRPRVIPGETMTVVVVKKGTERQQGVAYLDDGTMVVVEDGRYFMDKQIEVEVTSALQTDAGRMIFARPLHSQRGIDEHTDHKENRNNKDKKK